MGRSRSEEADLLNVMRLNFRAAACRNGGENKQTNGRFVFAPPTSYPSSVGWAKRSAEDKVPEKVVLREAGCFRPGAGRPGLRSTIFF